MVEKEGRGECSNSGMDARRVEREGILKTQQTFQRTSLVVQWLPGIEPRSLALWVNFLPSEPSGKPWCICSEGNILY